MLKRLFPCAGGVLFLTDLLLAIFIFSGDRKGTHPPARKHGGLLSITMPWAAISIHGEQSINLGKTVRAFLLLRTHL